MEIKKVGILGLGAVGSYFYLGLHDKLKNNLVVISDENRKDALKKNGLYINEKQYFPNVLSYDEVKDLDLLIIAVKYTGLNDIKYIVPKLINDNTLIISPLNGIDSEEVLEEVLPKNRIIRSMMKINSERKVINGVNSINFNVETTIGNYIGETVKEYGNKRIEPIYNLFKDTTVHCTIKDNIMQEKWMKFALNVTTNIPQAIISCGKGAYEDSEHVAFISEKLKEEVVLIAKGKGYDVSTFPAGSPARKNSRYSTLQDLDSKRHTEIDMFCGKIIKLGKELNIKTPYNEICYHLIKALEEKNDGKFDY